MAFSTQTVVSDGSLALLDISIEYLDRSEITVYFNSVPTAAWAWVGTTDKQITFTPAVAVGVVVLVKRTTVLSEIRHEFSLGAAFTAQSLDEGLKQVLHIAQEATEANFSGDFYSAINMHTNKIINLADPTLPQDAVTKSWAESAMTSQLGIAITQAGIATAQATNSAASAAAALVSQGLAQTAAASTDADVIASAASAAAALASQGAAAASATAASGSATAAAASATAALASENAAELAETNTLAKYDEFDDRWLGPKAVAPTLDNDGNALLLGAAYFDTAIGELRIWSGTAWVSPITRTALTGSARVPAGLTAERDVTPQAGYFRFNLTLNQFEGYSGTAWGSVGGGATGAPGNAVFMENDTNVTADYTITTGKNAVSAGPITIDTGVTVTVPTGSVWTIV